MDCPKSTGFWRFRTLQFKERRRNLSRQPFKHVATFRLTPLIAADSPGKSLLLPILHHGSSALTAETIDQEELDLGARVVKDLYFVVIKKYNDKIQDDARQAEPPIADLDLIGLSAKVEYMIAHEHKRFFSRYL